MRPRIGDVIYIGRKTDARKRVVVGVVEDGVLAYDPALPVGYFPTDCAQVFYFPITSIWEPEQPKALPGMVYKHKLYYSLPHRIGLVDGSLGSTSGGTVTMIPFDENWVMAE